MKDLLYYRDYRGVGAQDGILFGEKDLRNADISVRVRLKAAADGSLAGWDVLESPGFWLAARYRDLLLYGEFYYAAVLIGSCRLCLVKACATKTSQVYGRNIVAQTTVDSCFDDSFHTIGLSLKEDRIFVSLDGRERLSWTDTDGLKNKSGQIRIFTNGLTAEYGEVAAFRNGLKPYRSVKEPAGLLTPVKKALPAPDPEEYETGRKEDGPVFFYTGNTWHLPGDLAMVRGIFPAPPVRIRLCRLDDCRDAGEPAYTVSDSCDTLTKKRILAGAVLPIWREEDAAEPDMIQPSLYSFKFRIPAGLTNGIYTVEATFPGETKRYYLNAPAVTWTQGDEGGIMTPGGWLRISGYHLAPEDAPVSPVLLLKHESGQERRLKPSKIYSQYSVEFAVPDDLPFGEYTLLYHNGFGDSTAYSTPAAITCAPSPRASWPDTVMNVKDFGAAGDGRACDTDAIRAALKAAKEAGGGIVYFPAGRYFLDDTLTIPPGTVLRGESAVLVQIFIPPFEWDYGEIPEYLIRGTSDFAIEDITFAGSRIPTLITAGIADASVSKNIYIRRCRFHFNSASGVVTGNWNGERYRMIMNECCHWFVSDILSLGGENIQITDNDILSSGRPVSRGRKSHCLIRNNRMQPHVGNWSQFGHLEGGIIENNIFCGHTLVLSGDNLYLAGNTISSSLNNNREASTTDLGSGRYNGTMRFGENRMHILLVGANFSENEKAGFGLYIIDGKGAGQYRRIVSNTKDTLTIDLPFLVDPNEQSVVSIVEIRNHMFFYDNTIRNSGAVQFYGMQTDSVIDKTTIAGSFGIWGSGRFVYGVYQPNWYNSIVNNTITDGVYFWQYGYDAQSGSSQIKISARGGIAGTNIASLVRGNSLYDNSCIHIDTGGDADALQDLIVEGNRIQDSGNGIILGVGSNTAQNVVLSRNECTDVARPLTGSATWREAEKEGRILLLDS